MRTQLKKLNEDYKTVQTKLADETETNKDREKEISKLVLHVEDIKKSAEAEIQELKKTHEDILMKQKSVKNDLQRKMDKSLNDIENEKNKMRNHFEDKLKLKENSKNDLKLY